MAVLSYIDFFSTSVQVFFNISISNIVLLGDTSSVYWVMEFELRFSFLLLSPFCLSYWMQRVALSTVVNICKKLSSESPSLFMEAVPILCNLLQYEDRQV